MSTSNGASAASAYPIRAERIESLACSVVLVHTLRIPRRRSKTDGHRRPLSAACAPSGRPPNSGGGVQKAAKAGDRPVPTLAKGVDADADLSCQLLQRLPQDLLPV